MSFNISQQTIKTLHQLAEQQNKQSLPPVPSEAKLGPNRSELYRQIALKMKSNEQVTNSTLDNILKGREIIRLGRKGHAVRAVEQRLHSYLQAKPKLLGEEAMLAMRQAEKNAVGGAESVAKSLGLSNALKLLAMDTAALGEMLLVGKPHNGVWTAKNALQAKAFQRANGLKGIDGIPGRETLSALNKTEGGPVRYKPTLEAYGKNLNHYGVPPAAEKVWQEMKIKAPGTQTEAAKPNAAVEKPAKTTTTASAKPDTAPSEEPEKKMEPKPPKEPKKEVEAAPDQNARDEKLARNYIAKQEGMKEALGARAREMIECQTMLADDCGVAYASSIGVSNLDDCSSMSDLELAERVMQTAEDPAAKAARRELMIASIQKANGRTPSGTASEALRDIMKAAGSS